MLTSEVPRKTKSIRVNLFKTISRAAETTVTLDKQRFARAPLTPDVWNGETLRPQVERHADTQQKTQQHACLIQLIHFSRNWSNLEASLVLDQ